MRDDIGQLLASMNPGPSAKFGEDAEAATRGISALGTKAIPFIVQIGEETYRELARMVKMQAAHRPAGELQRHMGMARAVVKALSVFCKRRLFRRPIDQEPRALDLLSNLAEMKGGPYTDASKQLLKDVGHDERWIRQRCLLSLPITSPSHTRPISMANGAILEAIERRYKELENPRTEVQGDRYQIGSSYTHAHEVFRVGEDLFEIRARDIRG
jgi:hypothetical protein